MFSHARHLPAIVFTIEFIGKEVKLGLQCAQIFNWPRLARLQLDFFHFSVQADRFNRPSALLQALRGAIRVGLISEKEIMIKLRGVAERLVKFLIGLRAFWAWSEE